MLTITSAINHADFVSTVPHKYKKRKKKEEVFRDLVDYILSSCCSSVNIRE